MKDIYRPFSKFGKISLPKLKGSRCKGVHLTYPVRTTSFDRLDVQFHFMVHYNPITEVQSLVVNASGLAFNILLDDSQVQLGVSEEFTLRTEGGVTADCPKTLLRPTKYYRDKYHLAPYFCSYNSGKTLETTLYILGDEPESQPERILLRMSLVDIDGTTHMTIEASGPVNVVFHPDLYPQIRTYTINEAFLPVVSP